MKRFISLLALMAIVASYVHGFEVDDLRYEINPDGVSVTVYGTGNSGAVVIPESVEDSGTTYSVTSIGGSAFYDCSGLTSVTIGNSVTSIGVGAFSGCSGLTSIKIPNSVTSIGYYAFYGCNSLTKVEISDLAAWCRISFTNYSYSNPLYYAHHLYLNGSEIKDLVIPNSVTSIGGAAFLGCSGLTSVTIPNSVTSIGECAFSGCSGLTNLIWNAKNCSSNGNMSTGGITSATIGNEVEILPDNFLNGSKITEITIPNSVSTIGNDAFNGCSGLTSVTIPNSVTLIGSYAFSGCSGVTSWTIPNSITEIGEKAFDGTLWYNNQQDGLIYVGKVAYKYKGSMPSGTSISLEEGTVSISGECFKNCSGLTSIEIPNSVTSIGGSAFYGCSGLTSVTIPNSVTSIGNRAFSGCSGLISITIPYSVTSIGDGAFRLCSGLTSVTIPNSVTEIGYTAFYGCSGLTSVTIPNSVTSIDDFAFSGCSGLTSVTIGNSVTSIGTRAFFGCNGLKTVNWNAKTCNDFSEYSAPFKGLTGIKTFTFGNEVEKIPACLCCGLSGLTSVTIGNSVTSIGECAFSGCSGLTNLIWNAKNCSSNDNMSTGGITSATIGNEVEILPDNFLAGSKITEITIPNSVTSINNSAFRDCSGLTSVTIPNSVTLIGSYAFYNCSGVTSWTIPNSITEIGEKAFDGTLWYNNQQDGLIYVGKVAYKYKGSMPSGTSISLEEGTVSISGECFKNCSGLTSVAIPNSVTEIGYTAFMGCSGLTSVTIPNSVTSIGDYAFDGCSGLTSILVESGNTKYDSRNNCNAIIETSTNSLLAGCKNTIIPNSVISIGDYAFDGCSGLTSVTIPNSVTSIDDFAFSGCSGLTSVTIGNSVTSIGTGAFWDCSGLTSVTIPNSVTSIGDGAFLDCSGLKTVNWNAKNCSDFSFDSPFDGLSGITTFIFGNDVEHIPARICANLSGLISIVVESGNTKYDSRNNCNAIIETSTNSLLAGCKTTQIPNSVTEIGYTAFMGCSGLTSVTIPNSVTSIGRYAFSGCSGLTSVAIPNSVTSIGDGAFRFCSGLTSVTIGTSVTSIGNYAFRDCLSLTSVTNYTLTPQTIYSNVFNGVNIANCKLYVWHESLDAYKAANVWKDFDIQDMGGVDGIEVDEATKEVEGYYDLKGIRLNEPARGQVNIVRYTDGTAKKVVVKE